MPIPSQHEYESREIDEFLRQMREVDRAPLADRKESARHFAEAMARDPELVAERVSWLLHGNYGYGSYVKAVEVSRSPRMNQVAWLVQTAGAVEWSSPPKMTVAAWKKLTKDQKLHLHAAVERALRSFQQEHP